MKNQIFLVSQTLRTERVVIVDKMKVMPENFPHSLENYLT